MTKVTLILGSPRRGGNTETLAEAFLSAPGKAERIDRFRLYDMSFQGCIDCRGCWTQGRPCLFDDDLTPLRVPPGGRRRPLRLASLLVQLDGPRQDALGPSFAPLRGA